MSRRAHQPSFAEGRLVRDEGNYNVGERESSLDDPSLNATTYVNKLIKETRLGQLIDTQHELAASANNMDYEMQNAIYENYKKFVEANDLVVELQDSLVRSGDGFARLKDIISDTVAKSEDIDRKLNAQQDVIVRMNKARMTLQKLALLLKSPKKMKAALDRRAFDIAADVYADSRPVLEKYQGHRVMKEIKREMEMYRCQAVEYLRSSIGSGTLNAVDTVAMLFKLGEPADSLASIFIASQKETIKSIISALRDSLEACGLEQMAEVAEKEVRAFVRVLLDSASMCETFFESSNRFNIISLAKEALVEVLGEIEASLARKMKDVIVQTLCMDFSGHALDEHVSSKDIANQEDVLKIKYIYKTFVVLRESFGDLDIDIPEAFAPALLIQLVGKILQAHISATFEALEAKIFMRLKETIMKVLISQNSDDDPRSYAFLKMELKTQEVEALQEFSIVQSAAMTWVLQQWIKDEMLHSLMNYIHESWKDTLNNFAGRCAALLGEKKQLEEVPGCDKRFLEYAFKIPQNLNAAESPMSALTIFKTFGSMKCIDARVANLCQGIAITLPGHVGSPVQTDVAASNIFFRLQCSNTIERYSNLIQGRLETFLTSNLRKIQEATLPLSGPSDVAQYTLSTIRRVDIDFKNAEYNRQPSVEDGSEMSVGDVSSPQAISSVLLESFLKKEVEALRASSPLLSKAAFQQIQVDCYFLRHNMKDLVSSKSSEVSSLLDSCSLAAAECCSEPIVLDPITLDKLIA